jgi:hypothetical protein
LRTVFLILEIKMLRERFVMTLPGIPEVTEEMTFPENDQQMASQVVTQETAPPDITLEIVSVIL